MLIYPPRNTRTNTRYNYRALLIAHYQQWYERLIAEAGNTHNERKCKRTNVKESNKS